MDDEEFRRAKAGLSEAACVFEKALHCAYFKCQNVQATQIGERQALRCSQPLSQRSCEAYLQLAVQQSGFAIGRASLPAHLPFSQLMKVQVGSLQGMQALRKNESQYQQGQGAGDGLGSGLGSGTEYGTGVSEIIKWAEAEYSSLKDLNFSKIVPYISSFALPKRRRSPATKKLDL